MHHPWPEGWVELARNWKVAPEALVWGHRIYRASIEHDFPLVPTTTGWSQFLEFEYHQRAWSRTSEGCAYFAACRKVAQAVRDTLGPVFEENARKASKKELEKLRGTRGRLFTVPNPRFELPLIGTDPPEIVEFSHRIFEPDPIWSVMRFWVDWWLASACLREAMDRVIEDPVKEGLMALRLGAGSSAEQARHYQTVRSHLLPAAERVPGSDLVADDVFNDYVFERELPKARSGPGGFADDLLAGKVASVRGYVCDLKNALAKFHRNTDHLEDRPDRLDRMRVQNLDSMTLEETGTLLDGARSKLESIAGKHGFSIIRRIYENPEMSFGNVAGGLEVSISTVERTVRRCRARYTSLDPIIEAHWRPSKKS